MGYFFVVNVEEDRGESIRMYCCKLELATFSKTRNVILC